MRSAFLLETMPAYYFASVSDFLHTDSDAIVGRLTARIASDGFTSFFTKAADAWKEELEILSSALGVVRKQYPPASAWAVLLEYPIPRRQKRIDAVVLDEDIIFVVEFKVGSATPDRSALAQVEDYALDLRDFHAASAHHLIVPILVPTRYNGSRLELVTVSEDEPVQPVLIVDNSSLASTLTTHYYALHQVSKPPIDPTDWDHSPYKPVPTIVEAAEHLYAGHEVTEITRAHASSSLVLTTQYLEEVIHQAQEQSKKVICFVTGIPGSGKTLIGLQAAHSPRVHDSVFLSGNGPLVKIVSEALARDQARREPGVNLREARRRVTTFIQNVHVFLREYTESNPLHLPNHVVIFDEAQRAWDLPKSKKEFNRTMSEPMAMLSVMNRHSDWAVLIALVGGGQEIYKGEAGLTEWGNALAENFPNWDVHVSEEVLAGGSSVSGKTLFRSTEPPSSLRIIRSPELHLRVSQRSIRAEDINSWVNAMLLGDRVLAQQVASNPEFPIFLTGSLEVLRAELQRRTRGTRRCGLVASSGALRLRSYGIEVSSGFTNAYPFTHWFLAERDDFRSSFQLEVAATEFQCQGLELDWVGLCWGDDLVWSHECEAWESRILRGARWANLKNIRNREYLLNKYRVLLTRAREGTIIWVPPGDPSDPTRDPVRLQATADYLLQCGARQLPD